MDAAAALSALAERVRPVTLARDQRVAVLPSLEPLLPEGLPRGAFVAVAAAPGVAGATSLALTLVAGPSQAGAWVAAVGGFGRRGSASVRSLGLVAAAELGVVPERLVVVDAGEVPGSRLASVVAALVDGFDVVLMGSEARGRLRNGDTRRLAARIRERGPIVVGVGDGLPGGSAQVRLLVRSSAWQGVERGAGHLQARRATVEATGRGAASRPRQAELWLPSVSSRASYASGEASPPEARSKPRSSVSVFSTASSEVVPIVSNRRRPRNVP